jgi:hypothetical protein
MEKVDKFLFVIVQSMQCDFRLKFDANRRKTRFPAMYQILTRFDAIITACCHERVKMYRDGLKKFF